MTLFLVGGGPSENLSDVHDAYAASVGARARGRVARVACISAGRPDEVGQYVADYVNPLLTRLPDCQITEVYLLPADEDGNEQTSWPDDADQLDGVIVAGGHTPSYLAALAPHRAQLARLIRADVPWIGYSAGAMVTSRHAYLGGWQLGGRQVGNKDWAEGLDDLTVADGLALVTPTIVAHNDTGQLEAIAITCLEQNLAASAVAIDENTCLIVDPITGRTAHYGRGRLRWFSREADGVLVKTQYPED